ncbi:NAD(P)/FAD-dependent oxidoreductase [Edaphobacter sp.]|uniref:FAD-dependent oxidoreductase n=1 Tax=Edaphobacter sp. TaxID=1934404 RepID=UPI002DB65E62|nr:NAD(P)/FAD-dependent oxidoreductase [Edaphobacter sp.]HEU5342191.1 NAD(P)/FAD-dependent oxidoreductase [Edaphobacter sp.]
MRYGQDLRLLIVGGGIAGLTLAAALEQRGIGAEIVERAHGYGGVGYALSLWPAGLNVLNSLGLRAHLAGLGVRPDMYQAIDQRGRTLLEANFGSFASQYGDNFYISRASLVDALRAAVSIPVAFGRSITHLHQAGDTVAVTFNDGSTGEYDAVLGADGLGSETRRLVFGDLPFAWHGVTGWAFWTNIDIGRDTREVYGRGLYMGFFPSRGRPCCFAAAASPRSATDDPATRRAHLESLFSSFPDWARSALATCTDPSIWHDDFLDIRLPRWTQGRVALVGDAAHAILPSAGVGASLAIESAYVLADELSRTSSIRIPEALLRYEHRRRARVDGVQSQSRQLMWMIRPRNPLAVGIRNAVMRAVSPARFLSMFEPLMDSAI